MTDRLAGKVALITGGGGGIGEATARLFWEEGALVSVVDSDFAAAQTAASAIDPSGQRTLAIGADLTMEAEAERAVRETVARFGRLDSVANVAGVRVYGPITEATPESWDFIVDVNLKAVAYVSKFAVRQMIENGGGGTIVNVSSANAIQGRSGMAQYDATKAAVLALTRSMAYDHADQNIRINAVCPGPTLTMFHVRRRAAAQNISLEQAEADLRAATPRIPLKRQADPREIAYAILFLACPESSYITATTLMADGGLSA